MNPRPRGNKDYMKNFSILPRGWLDGSVQYKIECVLDASKYTKEEADRRCIEIHGHLFGGCCYSAGRWAYYTEVVKFYDREEHENGHQGSAGYIDRPLASIAESIRSGSYS